MGKVAQFVCRGAVPDEQFLKQDAVLPLHKQHPQQASACTPRVSPATPATNAAFTASGGASDRTAASDQPGTAATGGHPHAPPPRLFCAACLEGIKRTDEESAKECKGCHRWYHMRDPCANFWQRMFGNSPGGQGLKWFHSDACYGIENALHKIADDGEVDLRFLDKRIFDQYTLQITHLEQDDPKAMRSVDHMLTMFADAFPSTSAPDLMSEADYSLLLRHIGDPVAATTLDVYGPDFATLNVLASKVRKAKAAYHAGVLVLAVERLLHDVGVRNIIVECEDEDQQETWRKVFGYVDHSVRDMRDMTETIPRWHARDLADSKFVIKRLRIEVPEIPDELPGVPGSH